MEAAKCPSCPPPPLPFLPCLPSPGPIPTNSNSANLKLSAQHLFNEDRIYSLLFSFSSDPLPIWRGRTKAAAADEGRQAFAKTL